MHPTSFKSSCPSPRIITCTSRMRLFFRVKFCPHRELSRCLCRFKYLENGKEAPSSATARIFPDETVSFPCPMESVTCFVCPSFAETFQFFRLLRCKRTSVSFPAPVFASGKPVISSSADSSSAQISHGAPAAHFTFLYHLIPASTMFSMEAG